MYFFFTDSASTEIYTLSLHDALPIYDSPALGYVVATHQSLSSRVGRSVWTYYWALAQGSAADNRRSEEHTSELQSRVDLVCRLLLEKKKKTSHPQNRYTESRLDT